MEKIDARNLPPEALEHLRRPAFVLLKRGNTRVHITGGCRVHVGTLMTWARRVEASRVDAAQATWPLSWLGTNAGAGSSGTVASKIIASNFAQFQLNSNWS